MQRWLLTVGIGGSIVVFEATLIFTEVEHFPLSTMRDDHLRSLRAAELQEFQTFHQSSQCLPVKLCQFDVVDINSSVQQQRTYKPSGGAQLHALTLKQL